MPKKLISEQMILDAVRRADRIVFYEEGTIVTDAARDRAKQLNVRLEIKKEMKHTPSITGSQKGTQTPDSETIVIGSDHGGFSLKEILKPFLANLGYNIVDVGTNNEESCDYPDFAYAVAKMVSSGGASRGIMIDSVGIASSIVANKVNGIRATCCFDEFSSRSSREHNNANILTLGGKTLGVELAKSIVKVWMETQFGGGRHQKRIDKIADIEKRVIKSS
jgi:ribose 5-phosphate isomerase B